jgi:serine/threonine protein kinase
MTMISPLSDDERSQLSMRADEFHAELMRGKGADWEPFLKGLPERVRLAVLNELVIIDMIHRWEHKDQPTIEDYVTRFPEYGPIARVPTEAILEEYRCRRKAGEKYDVAQYRNRFPVQFPLIQRELETVESQGSAITDGTVAIESQVYASVLPSASASVLPHAQLRGSVAEEYEFVRVLGRGVFGEVWLSKKRTSGIEKAIKIVNEPADRETSKRERRSLELIKNLRHPYLLSTEDFWVADHRLHIVMELADHTLRNRLEKCREEGSKGIPELELLGYIREAAEGLDFLHSRHIVHRDVKPDNILILNGHAKVADFGLAWHQEKLLAPMKTFAGTPAYMAPEVWGKEGGPASDLYSLAVAYTEMRQGHAPFSSQQLAELMLAHLDGSHDFEEIIHEEERKVLVKALSRAPEDRYPSCMAFVEALSISLGLSAVPRSSAISKVQSRAVPAPEPNPSSLKTRSDAVKTHKPHEPVASEPADEKKSRAGAIATSIEPARLPQKQLMSLKTVMAGFLTVGILGGAGGVAIWLLSRKDNQSPDNSSTTPTITANNGSPPTGPGTGPRTTQPSPPPSEGVLLPPRAFRDQNAKVELLADNRKVYDSIFIPIGNEKVRFRLIPGGPQSVPTFYMMESKVWNELYRAGTSMLPPGSEAIGPDDPVMNTTVEEAIAFARKSFDGKLPSPDEWDVAAGLYAVTEREEVTRPGGSPRVSLRKPQPTHGDSAGSDIDHYGLRDMAGNGREWTRMILTQNSGKEIGSTPPAATDRIILRGWNYTLSRGLTFEKLRYEQANPLAQYATVRSPYTSFRVAIFLP